MNSVIKFNDATLTFTFVEDGSGFITALHVKNNDDMALNVFTTPFMEGQDVFEKFTSRIVEYTELAEELRRYTRNCQDDEDADRYRKEAERAYDAAQVYRSARGLFFHAQARVMSNYWRLPHDVEVMEEFQRLINEEGL